MLTDRGQVHGLRETGEEQLEYFRAVLIVDVAVRGAVRKAHTCLPDVFTAVDGLHIFWTVLQENGVTLRCRAFTPSDTTKHSPDPISY